MTEAARPPSLPDFLRSKVASRFRDMVSKADQKVAQAQREAEDLRAAEGSIGWEISDGSRAKWFINIADGQMTITETAAGDPFMTIVLSEADWALFVGRANAGAMLTRDDRPFGKARIERVRMIKGSIRVILTELPEGGEFRADVHFGRQRSAEPKTTIQIPADVAAELSRGTLNPQAAFMQGQLKLLGDMAFAMELGMALAL